MVFYFFFFNDTATTEIYTLSLHDALPILTLPMGIWAAVRKDKPTDHLIRAGFLFTLTTPSFWLGILLILLFSLRLHLFPVAGFGEGFTGHLWYLFLPAFTLALQLSAVL